MLALKGPFKHSHTQSYSQSVVSYYYFIVGPCSGPTQPLHSTVVRLQFPLCSLLSVLHERSKKPLSDQIASLQDSFLRLLVNFIFIVIIIPTSSLLRRKHSQTVFIMCLLLSVGWLVGWLVVSGLFIQSRSCRCLLGY